jgi:hypothetical protein
MPVVASPSRPWPHVSEHFPANHTQEARDSHLAYNWLGTNYGWGGTIALRAGPAGFGPQAEESGSPEC